MTLIQELEVVRNDWGSGWVVRPVGTHGWTHDALRPFARKVDAERYRRALLADTAAPQPPAGERVDG